MHRVFRAQMDVTEGLGRDMRVDGRGTEEEYPGLTIPVDKGAQTSCIPSMPVNPSTTPRILPRRQYFSSCRRKLDRAKQGVGTNQSLHVCR